MNIILILLFISGTSQSLTIKKDATNNTPLGLRKPVQDTIDINGRNETIPPFTDVTDLIPPQPSPTPNPSNHTTASPNTTTTTPTTSTTAKPTSPTPPTTSPTPPTTSPTPPTTKPTTPTNATTTTVPPSTSTEKPSTTVKPTPAPPAPTPGPSTTSKPIEPTTAVPDHHRRFDGPSFIGGIVLALGLVAIGFVAFKFYKARTELNYHTL